jgi:hypothetical protein
VKAAPIACCAGAIFSGLIQPTASSALFTIKDRRMAAGLEPIVATIASGTALSAAVPLGAKTLHGIAMSAGWDAAALTFQVSYDGGTTFQEMQSTSAVVSYTAAAAQFIAIDPAIWRGINMIKVRSGTSGAPVNQTADRTLNLIVRPA